MSDVVDIKPAPTKDDFEFVSDLARFSEGIASEADIKRKYRLANEVWEEMGNDDELVRAIERQKERRVRDGSHKREKAQKHIIKGPDILSGIAEDSTASPRHRVDAIKTLDGMAANGPAAAGAGTFFEITINLGADQDGKPVIEHYRKPRAIDINPTDTSSDPNENLDSDTERYSKSINTNDTDPHSKIDTGLVAAFAAKKLTEDGGGQGHL